MSDCVFYAMAPRRNGGERRVKVLSYNENKKHYECFFRENGNDFKIYYEKKDITPIDRNIHYQPCSAFSREEITNSTHNRKSFDSNPNGTEMSSDICSIVSSDISSLMLETIVSEDRSSSTNKNTQFDDSIKEDTMGVPDQSKDIVLGSGSVQGHSSHSLFQFVKCFLLISFVVFTLIFYLLFFLTVIERTNNQDNLYKNCLKNYDWFCKKKDLYSIFLEAIAEFLTKISIFIVSFIIFFVIDNVQNIFYSLYHLL